MRLVSREIGAVLEANKTTPANFGLVFNKWLVFKEDKGIFKPVVKEAKQPLIDSYEKTRKQANELLKKQHLRQASYCRVMEAVGWHSFVVEAKLTSPYVSGLGMAHPTETGLVLDHTTGLPYIPAASQKGVVRLAHIINSLLDSDEEWQKLDTLFEKGVVKKEKNRDTGKTEICWQEDNASKTLFGFSEKKDALAGQLVVLDAYPLTAPSLGEEILNPHFMKYYGGDRGPTEDQSPIPVKFLVVKPGARFVFRLLLRRQLASALETNHGNLALLVEKNLVRAITEEGMGAKTAIGFGRFKIIAKQEPEAIQKALRKKKKKREEQALLKILTPLEREMREVIAKDRDQNKKEYVKLMTALKNKKWSGKDAVFVAEHIRNKMKEDKSWKETSSKKNPKKDKQYQRTLEVMKFIEP